jgi:hypothetical protein
MYNIKCQQSSSTRAIHKWLTLIDVMCRQRYSAIQEICMLWGSGRSLTIHPIYGTRGWRGFHFHGMIVSVSGVLSCTMEGNVLDKRVSHVCFGRKGSHQEAICGEAATCHSRIFRWVESCNSEHKTVKHGISPGHPTTACTLSAVPCLSDITENSCVAIDKLQLATSLCCATIHAIIQRFKNEEGLCTLGFKRSQPQTKKRRVQNC